VDALIEWGYGVIATFQSLRNPVFDGLFHALTFLGEEEFYLVLVPILYWLVNKRLASRFAVLFLLSAYVNSVFKTLANQPRPSAERVEVLVHEESGGLPSGHAQNAAVSWGLLAANRPQSWFRWAMVALIFGIGISRLYLGAHFPHDTLGGWLIGAVMLALFLALEPRIVAWLERQPLTVQVALPAGVALLLAVLHPVSAALSSMATLFGIAVGVPLERAQVRFRERGVSAQKLALRLLLGLVVALLIWRGLKPLLEPLGHVGTFVRYALLGLWLSVGGPWLFVRTGLALREEGDARLPLGREAVV
jgi:membrane-associated phospholipid phosphatase